MVITYIACCAYLLGNDFIHSPAFWPILASMLALTLSQSHAEAEQAKAQMQAPLQGQTAVPVSDQVAHL